MKKIVLKIDGMSCSACSNGLEKYLKKQSGIIDASVNLVMATASISYEDSLDLATIDKYILKAGFMSLGPFKENDDVKKKSVMPFVWYGLLAFFVMYLSMSHLSFLPKIPYLNIDGNIVCYSLCLFFISCLFLWYGFDILRSGIKNLVHLMPNMDTLVGIGVISSFLYSSYGVIMILLKNSSYVHNLYFESVCFVIYFIKLGRFIDHNSKEKTKDAIKKLVTITPQSAKLKRDSKIVEVTIDEVKPNDILVSYPGDVISVDGVIVKGSSHLDEAFITGESKPSLKSINDNVIAGSINYDGYIEYKALKIGKDSTISEIVRLVIDATNTKAPIAKLADKVSGYFVPFILIVSVVTLLVSMCLNLGIGVSINRLVTVLVVACPCALGLATPLAIVVSEGICAKNGILVKSGATLEVLSKIDTVVFDKTGTLTNGALTISKINNYSDMTDEQLLKILASLECKSTHPIAKAVMNYINENGISIDDDIDIKTLDGYGISGKKTSKTYYAGNRKLVERFKIDNPYIHDEAVLSNDGNSIVYVIDGKTIIGMIGVCDTVRKNAKVVVDRLSKMNIDVIMLTGDNRLTASKVASSLGIKEIISDVVPKEKASLIKELQADGRHVLMVGDGINDAPSLASSDVGVSMGSGTDIAGDTADVILLHDDLQQVVSIIKLGRKTVINIKENLFFAFLYNICMVPIAAGVFSNIVTINPMIACICMILSSLTVIFNALRLSKIKL